MTPDSGDTTLGELRTKGTEIVLARNDRLGRAALGLLKALLTPDAKRQSPKANRQSAHATGKMGSPGSLPSRGGTSHVDSREYDSSPGQYGSSATRDLTRAEIAQLSPRDSPRPDGDPDPGEVIWTWVPYVENDGRGKDRPVLIISRLTDGSTAGCYLSTKCHDGYIPVGRGAWDSKGRPSFLNPERLLRITDRGMRREGTVMSKDQFAKATAEIMNRL